MNKEKLKLYKVMVDLLAQFSKDKKVKVGALLLKEGRVIATGYNGQPSGVPHRPIEVDGHDISTLHAEMNCLVFAAKHGIQVKDCEMFTTHFPCVHCTKMLYQAGIQKVYYLNKYYNEENPFKNLLRSEKV